MQLQKKNKSIIQLYINCMTSVERINNNTYIFNVLLKLSFITHWHLHKCVFVSTGMHIIFIKQNRLACLSHHYATLDIMEHNTDFVLLLILLPCINTRMLFYKIL